MKIWHGQAWKHPRYVNLRDIYILSQEEEGWRIKGLGGDYRAYYSDNPRTDQEMVAYITGQGWVLCEPGYVLSQREDEDEGPWLLRGAL